MGRPKKIRKLTEQEQKIAELIYNDLDYMYCDNCRFGFEISEEDCTDESGISYGCEDCHRKYNGWGISKAASENLVRKIFDNTTENK